jgi:hypothetical protein
MGAHAEPQAENPGSADLPQGRQIIVTLVHGTWATGAPWTRPGSLFPDELDVALRSLGADAVTFVDDFPWSGKNLHEDRRDASDRLIPASGDSQMW